MSYRDINPLFEHDFERLISYEPYWHFGTLNADQKEEVWENTLGDVTWSINKNVGRIIEITVSDINDIPLCGLVSIPRESCVRIVISPKLATLIFKELKDDNIPFWFKAIIVQQLSLLINVDVLETGINSAKKCSLDLAIPFHHNTDAQIFLKSEYERTKSRHAYKLYKGCCYDALMRQSYNFLKLLSDITLVESFGLQAVLDAKQWELTYYSENGFPAHAMELINRCNILRKQQIFALKSTVFKKFDYEVSIKLKPDYYKDIQENTDIFGDRHD